MRHIILTAEFPAGVVNIVMVTDGGPARHWQNTEDVDKDSFYLGLTKKNRKQRSQNFRCAASIIFRITLEN